MTVEPGLVSIVVPCYNYGRFLGEAIESALAQTYRPLEIIVVDDGSTDDTAQVAVRYPVQLLSQPNTGVCVAVNSGVHASHGEFVMRLDADDVLAPTYVEEMVAALTQDPQADLAYSHGTYFGAATGPFPLRPFGPDALAEGAHVTCLAMIRRSGFDRVGGYDPSMATLRCEDWDLWLSFADRGMYGVIVDRPLWGYRRHTNGSRNTLSFGSAKALRRELGLVARLQDKHSGLFATRALLRRLRAVPHRVRSGEMPLRTSGLLVAFYAVMLARRSLGLSVVAQP